MRIYLKTPLINKSKIIPHFVEHCAWHPAKNLDKYFELSYWLDAVTCIDYTYFEFDNRVDYKEAIKSLISPITEKSFLYEKEIIQQELEDLSYGQKIYEYVVKKYLDSDFSMNKYEEVARENVKNYHKKYYTPDNIIVVEDTNNYEVIQSWFKAEKNNKIWSKKYQKSLSNSRMTNIYYIFENLRTELDIGRCIFSSELFVFSLHIFKDGRNESIIILNHVFMNMKIIVLSSSEIMTILHWMKNFLNDEKNH